MLKVINVVGARPNFMKVAPIAAAMKRRSSEFQSFLVHTGQHYDPRMSDAFLSDLDMPEPDIYLGGLLTDQIADLLLTLAGRRRKPARRGSARRANSVCRKCDD
jgi:UDP-N-acetylglucosamine 2-epimerase (non-hydrolysing)